MPANPSRALTEDTQNVAKAFSSLSTDDKLALLYRAYEKMGDSITPAEPTAAEPELAPKLLGDYYELSDDEQLQIMRDIVECKDTEYSRAYGALTANNQLVVWYAWAIAMGDTVVDMPEDYEITESIQNVLNHIEDLDFEGQITVLREVAQNMGYSDVKRVNSTQETGVTPSL
ncbi:MAG: orange carotenoid protein [Desertifilum sp. SIO1I2]|nr:orange carotenoid protein [Desertifilum sp. SIO1I2]